MNFKLHVKHSKCQRRSNHGGAQISEFGAALVLFGVVSMLFVCTLSFVYAVVTGYAVTQYAAAAASTSVTFADGLSKCESAAECLTARGIGAIAGLTPIHGHNHSGVDLYIIAVNQKTQDIAELGPNVPLTKNVDPDKFAYSYRLVTHFQRRPLMPCAPFGLSKIAGIGMPVTLDFACSKPIEHPGSIVSLVQNRTSLEQ